MADSTAVGTESFKARLIYETTELAMVSNTWFPIRARVTTPFANEPVAIEEFVVERDSIKVGADVLQPTLEAVVKKAIVRDYEGGTRFALGGSPYVLTDTELHDIAQQVASRPPGPYGSRPATNCPAASLATAACVGLGLGMLVHLLLGAGRRRDTWHV